MMMIYIVISCIAHTILGICTTLILIDSRHTVLKDWQYGMVAGINTLAALMAVVFVANAAELVVN